MGRLLDPVSGVRCEFDCPDCDIHCAGLVMLVHRLRVKVDLLDHLPREEVCPASTSICDVFESIWEAPCKLCSDVPSGQINTSRVEQYGEGCPRTASPGSV
jgi:hypothetical protein